MKKIIIITNTSGGLYLFRKELIQELIKSFYDIIVITTNTGRISELKELGCKVDFLKMNRRGKNPFSELELLINYYRKIKKEKPDLVITYTIKPNIYGSLACELLKIPYAVNITGLGTAFQKQGMLRKFVTALYKITLRKAKVVFFENCENRQIFIDEYIVPERKTCLLNGAGVNLEHFSYQDYPQDTEEVRFLFVGRVMKEKGVNELFKAIRMLRKDGVNCSLDVVGGFEENYEPIIKRFENEGWLRYHGFQEDVRPFIKNCHCFVLPSWHEGMANTNLECAASGRPVITSNINGCLEAVEDTKSGFLCEKQNARSLYEVMKKFVEMSVEDRTEMGRCGRLHMIEVFDKNKVVRETIKALII